MQAVNPARAADVYSVLTVEGSVASRNHTGGTAPAQVKRAIERVRGILAQ
jgi:argininosuccinate lyase